MIQLLYSKKVKLLMTIKLGKIKSMCRNEMLKTHLRICDCQVWNQIGLSRHNWRGEVRRHI
jgi:hypothetical protein